MRRVLVTHMLVVLRSVVRSMDDLSRHCFNHHGEKRRSFQQPVYLFPYSLCSMITLAVD